MNRKFSATNYSLKNCYKLHAKRAKSKGSYAPIWLRSNVNNSGLTIRAVFNKRD